MSIAALTEFFLALLLVAVLVVGFVGCVHVLFVFADWMARKTLSRMGAMREFVMFMNQRVAQRRAKENRK